MAERILARKKSWQLLRFSSNGKFTYWVVSYPKRSTTLQFSSLKKAKDYFKSK